MNYINPDAPAAGLTRLLNMRDNNPATQLAYVPTRDIAAMDRMGGLEFNPYSGIPQARGVAAVAEGGSIDEAPLAPVADELASRGRYGDSMLLHVRPDELQGLASLGTLTINPDTGLPEAFSFKSLLPAVGGIAGSILLGPAFAGIVGPAFGVGIGAGLGSFAGGLAAGQKPGQAALGGLISGATAGFMQGLTPGLEAGAAPGLDSAGGSAITDISGQGFVEGATQQAIAANPASAFPGASSSLTAAGAPQSFINELSQVPATSFSGETLLSAYGPNTPTTLGVSGINAPAASAAISPPVGTATGLQDTFIATEAYKPGTISKLLGAEDIAKNQVFTRQAAIDKGFIPSDITTAERASQVLTDPKTYVGAGISTLMQPPPPMEYQEPEPLELGPSYVPRERTLAGGVQSPARSSEEYLRMALEGGYQPLSEQYRYIAQGGLVGLVEGGTPEQGVLQPQLSPAVQQPSAPPPVLQQQEQQISERARQDELLQRDQAMSRGQQFIEQPTGNQQLFQQMQNVGQVIGQQVAQGPESYATPPGQSADTSSFVSGTSFGFNTGGLVGLEEGGQLAPRPKEKPMNVIRDLPQEELYKRMIVREAGNQGLLGMALVARSIDNRFKTLNQNDKIKPSLFGAEDKTIRGILLGDKQYSPISDFSAARELTDSEEAAAMEAISLSKDIGGLSNLLQERGYDKDQIFKLLNSTGFRRHDAVYDKSQEINTQGFGDHVFNMAGNPEAKYKNIEELKIEPKEEEEAKAKPKFEDVPFNKAFPSVVGKEYMEMMQKLYDNLPKKAEGGDIGGYFEGQVVGNGDGMSDQILFEVEGNNPDKALLSRDEYVIPADVVAMLGNGSSNAGSEQLDNFIKGVRQESFGTQKQQRELNAQQGLRGLV